MKKRGQFYLVAAVIIVMIVSGMTSVSVYTSVRPDKPTIYDLGDDLNRESYKILEYGIYNKENIRELIGNFAGEDIADYFLKKSNNANIIYVYGDKNKLVSLHYDKQNKGSINIGGSRWESYKTYSIKKEINFQEENPIIVKIKDKNYSFDITNNQIFYFIIMDEEENEKFVKVSQDISLDKKPGKNDNKEKKWSRYKGCINTCVGLNLKCNKLLLREKCCDCAVKCKYISKGSCEEGDDD